MSPEEHAFALRELDRQIEAISRGNLVSPEQIAAIRSRREKFAAGAGYVSTVGGLGYAVFFASFDLTGICLATMGFLGLAYSSFVVAPRRKREAAITNTELRKALQKYSELEDKLQQLRDAKKNDN